jgi:hypothetical protein
MNNILIIAGSILLAVHLGAMESLPPVRVETENFSWQPSAQPPAPRLLMSESAYMSQRAAILASVDHAVLLDPSYPPNGVVVSNIVPGSQASQAGIKDGDVIIAIDGRIISDQHELGDARLPRMQRLTMWSRRDGEFHIDLAQKKFGVDISGWGFFGGEYARSEERDPRWDDDLIVAIVALTIKLPSPRLAETAVHHAISAGYSGRMIALLMCEISEYAGLHDKALTYGFRALSEGANKNTLRTISTMYSAAIAARHLRLAYELQKSYPDHLFQPVHAWLKAAVTNPDVQDNINLLESVDNMTPIIDRLTGVDAGGLDVIDAMKNTGNIDFAVSPDCFQPWTFGPAIDALYFSCSFRFSASESRPTKYPASVNFSILDSADISAQYIDINCFENGCVDIKLSSNPHGRSFYDQFDGKIEQNFELIKVGSQFQVCLNGRNLCISPPFKPQSAFLRIRAVGATGIISGIQCDGVLAP